MPRITEEEIADNIEIFLGTLQSGGATIARLIEELPNFVTLSPEDLARSPTRPNEPLWHQQVRNITSHQNQPGNAIYEGRLVAIPGGLALPGSAAATAAAAA